MSAHTSPVDVLCIGLACVDLTLGVATWPVPDSKIRATRRKISPGGPAAVAAAQIARLGGRAAFAGRLGEGRGDPFGTWLVDSLQKVGVDATACVRDTQFETPFAAVLLPEDGRRAVISHRDESKASSPEFVRARVVLADGHRPDWVVQTITHARACGAPIVLDAGSWHEGTKALLGAADHVVASEAFAREALSGRDPAECLGDWGAPWVRPDATVVATLGARGLVWRRGVEHGRLPAFDVTVVDTNGAGDAFHGAYALGLAKGLPFSDVLRYASAAGALACARIGAWDGLATASEVAALLAR